MKFSEQWLREWVNPSVDGDELVHQLTMLGLEVDTVEPASGEFTDVVVGEVVACDKHPDADKLSVCRVDVGQGDPLDIVCGAPNVRLGLKAPTALVGGVLPGGLKIRKAKLRGVASHGMLCSDKELGLGEGGHGLLELPADAPVGENLRTYLQLDDQVIDIDLTPNRGDCFSVLGVAREIGVRNRADLTWPGLDPVPAASDETFDVVVEAPEACPRFCGRVVKGIRTDAETPLWMQERLRRSGVRPIHPVVDVTNYVMLELGQPMHGFDLATLDGGIVVRMAGEGETLVLLDGREIALEPDMLVIADHGRARALAGIMGGDTSGVGDDTTDIFLESAYFAPLAVAGRARRFGLHTDASMRFERGVDPEGQRRAVERATALLLDIVGGVPGPVIEVVSEHNVPERCAVRLRHDRLNRVIGSPIDGKVVADILGRLGADVDASDNGWNVTPPSFRHDMAIEEDLIEEVARIHGYDNVPEDPGAADVFFPAITEEQVSESRLKHVLVDRGYQEVVTYSFVDEGLQSKVNPDLEGIPLANPISSEMAVMRTSLWPGLIAVCRQNQSRQQGRVKIFESGLKFYSQDNEIKQIVYIAGLLAGDRNPEHWSGKPAPVDFYDGKADVEAMLSLGGELDSYEFTAGEHSALHPGRNAKIVRDGRTVGWIGVVHPALAKKLELSGAPVLFELEEAVVLGSRIPAFEPISRYPSVRSDRLVQHECKVSAH